MSSRKNWTFGAGVLTTVALALIGAGAMASAVTLAIADRAPVMNTGGTSARASIVVTGHGRAVYTLSGDSTRHPKCLSAGCLAIWPAVTVASARSLRAAHGIHGHLAIWRHGALRQLTVNGHPLYTYIGDSRARTASGEGIVSFGGTWHVLTPSGRSLTFPTPTAAPSAPPAATTRASPSAPPAPPASCPTGYCY